MDLTPDPVSPAIVTASGLEDVPLVAADGRPLSARHHRPVGEVVATALVLGGTAVPQRFYASIARHLAASGIATLTFDYRGVGRSRRERLAEEPATMLDWAQRDAEAALRWLATAHPDRPVTALAHSFGGQALGLVPSSSLLSRAVLVASQSGWVGHWPMPVRLRNRAVFGALLPLAARTLGYWPPGLGLGEGLPGGVAREWARWCSSPGYLADHVPPSERRHGELAIPLRSYAIEDDDYAPPAAIEALLAWYERSPIERRTVSPRALGIERVGHFGFFREPAARPLWSEIASFLAGR